MKRSTGRRPCFKRTASMCNYGPIPAHMPAMLQSIYEYCGRGDQLSMDAKHKATWREATDTRHNDNGQCAVHRTECRRWN